MMHMHMESAKNIERQMHNLFGWLNQQQMLVYLFVKWLEHLTRPQC